MKSKKYYIGIDGGGTKTACVVGEEDGTILAEKIGPSSNIQSKPFREAIQVLSDIIQGVAMEAEISVTQVDVIYMTLAGAGRVNDREKIFQSLTQLLPENVEIMLDHDAKGALAAGTAGESGIVLIAGTGSIAYAFPGSDVPPFRVGGWGYLLGDEGSGFDIGRKAVAAVMKAYDGRGPATKLTAFLLDHFEREYPDELISLIYGKEDARSYIASAARLVFEAAEQQDSIAKEILTEAQSELLSLVYQAYRKLPGNAANMLVLNGGLFQNPSFKMALKVSLQTSFPDLEIIEPSIPSEAGAYMAALHKKDIRLTNSLVTKVHQTWNNREGTS
ncbi:MAG TPA: BadF/BadG/BcrA/BcrD ATPase family protein [Pseudogracilibacillus sp.]|nr:BadF/BadG/BcrA/BcrD ATPase family protein [Pseudogracilibacillus sp.]